MWRSSPEECILPDGTYLVVGDLQNGYDVLPYLKSLPIKKLFIGDFLDSRDGVPPRGQVAALETVLEMIKAGEAVAIPGNHEVSYLAGQRGLVASGYDRSTAILLQPLALACMRLLKPFLWHPGSQTLFTHAGLTLPLWEEAELNSNEPDSIVETLHGWSLNFESPYYYIGQSRGGYEPFGGPLWCDWNGEFEPVEGIAQVVGHTREGGKSQAHDGQYFGTLRCKRNNNWNVDCLGAPGDFSFLIFDTRDGFRVHSVSRGEVNQKYVESIGEESEFTE